MKSEYRRLRKFFNDYAYGSPVIGLASGLTAAFATAASGMGHVDGNVVPSVVIPGLVGVFTFAVATWIPAVIGGLKEDAEVFDRVAHQQNSHKGMKP